MMGVRMVLEFIFTPAELKILDDPLPFKRSETKQDKDEDAEIQDISTEVRHQIHYFTGLSKKETCLRGRVAEINFG